MTVDRTFFNLPKSGIPIYTMAKGTLSQPLLVLLYGFPGAGKTCFSRQFCERIQAAHLQADRLRFELFEKPRYDKQEQSVISQLMNYMCEEFLSSGVSVVYDTNAMRTAQRRSLYDIARRFRTQSLLVWFQMDVGTSFARSAKRDRRRPDDKYAAVHERSNFNRLVAYMQNPTPSEEHVVISGKHTFDTQYDAVSRRLRDMGLLANDSVMPVVKPGLVNLVPQPNINKGRVDTSRRNVIIR